MGRLPSLAANQVIISQIINFLTIQTKTKKEGKKQRLLIIGLDIYTMN